MSIIEAFVDYLEDTGVGIFGQDIFIGKAPSSNRVEDSIMWITESGGSKIVKATTGESIKQYSLNVYKRDRNYQLVKDSMYALEESLNCSGCVQLDGYETLQIEVTAFPIDQDLDSEDRMVGLLQVDIQTYDNCR